MDKSKAGKIKKRSPDGLSLTNQNTINNKHNNGSIIKYGKSTMKLN